MRNHLTVGAKRIGYVTFESTGTQPGRSQPVRTLLLLHAFPLNADMWDAQAAALPAGWRIVAPDLRGFGQSSLPGGEAAMDDYAGDLADLLDALHVHEAVVAGNSIGGYIAFALLRNAPHYVSGLVLVDTKAQADSDEGRASRRRMLELIDRAGTAGVVDEMLPRLLGASTQRDRPDLIQRVRTLMISSTPQALKAAVTAMMGRPDSHDLLARIHLPALVIAGEEDALIPVSAAEQMQQAMPGSVLEIIPRAGHLPTLEQPAACNAVLKRFLGRI